MFGRAAAIISIPDQQALINYADGVETLVIETRFNPAPAVPPVSAAPKTAESPYAWVVPVPGPRSDESKGASSAPLPEVFAVSTGTFPSLRAACAPRIEHNITDAVPPFICLSLILLISLLFNASKGTNAFVKYLAIAFLLLVLVMFLLPSLGSARSSARGPSDSGVELLSRNIVGSFDVAIVGAADAAASDELISWLTTEGFYVPPEARPVVTDYAKRGWVFLAAKLRQAEPADGAPVSALTPHPLGVRFRTSQAVYPMRLTAVGGEPLGLDLYIAGDSQASVAGMSTIRCAHLAQVKPSTERYYSSPRGDEVVVICHQQLAQLIGKSSVITKLSATLKPAQMTSDLKIRWNQPVLTGGMKYSSHGASSLAMNWVSGLWLCGLLVVTCAAAIRQWPNPRVAARSFQALIPCVLVGLVIYLALPKIPVEVSRGRYYSRSAAAPILIAAAGDALRKQHPGFPSLENAQSSLEAKLKEIHAADSYYTQSLPRPPQHEDSPFNYTVRPSSHPDEYDIVYYDDRGRESLLGVIHR